MDEEKAVEKLMRRFEEVNLFFIRKIAEQMKAIGELNPSSVHQVAIMTRMGTGIAEITRQLQKAAKLTVLEVKQIYRRTLEDTYTAPRFRRALQHKEISQAEKEYLTQYTQAISDQTAGQLINLSNTTAVSKPYREAVDKAILAVSSGMTDYRSATRQIIHDLGYNGLQVYYQSGYHRRLDTAVRQNVVDGNRQIAQHCSDRIGEALGFDAFEISAHKMSAPDHEPVQGRVFLKAEFEKMQAGQPFQDVTGKRYEGFRRPIGEWNCQHMAMSFSTQFSVPRYSEEQLTQWARENRTGCETGGRHYTIYEASQLMRKIETAIRREKDVAVAARAAGDDVLRQRCQMRINALSAKYGQVAKAAGLAERRERTRVQGFRMVKAAEAKSQKGS